MADWLIDQDDGGFVLSNDQVEVNFVVVHWISNG